jgi:hypothetical protein
MLSIPAAFVLDGVFSFTNCGKSYIRLSLQRINRSYPEEEENAQRPQGFQDRVEFHEQSR